MERELGRERIRLRWESLRSIQGLLLRGGLMLHEPPSLRITDRQIAPQRRR